eukprot:GHVU01107727.1.p5 GENE.GHVU01107727.1~~GHVU01107727.1.p5  ORF type:complete len:133 (-),score=6.92 GHVU01107727.1:1190-1588(-)
MNLRIRIPTDDGVESFMVLLAPDVSGAEELHEYIVDVLTPLDPSIRRKVYGVTADGCSVNVGEHNGVFNRLTRSCSGPMVLIWCPLHQLDLVQGEVVDGLRFELGGVTFAVAVSTVRDLGLRPQCPALSARW